ncbi:CYT protein, partial [Atractosteus spatula]|nr:CYT protein [Atractosteus spatula]
MALLAVQLSAFLAVAVLRASAGPVAPPLPVDPNSQGVWGAADYATVYYNLRSEDKYIYKITAILDVQVQIDGGIKYTMDVELGRTRCENGKTPDLESCVLFTAPGEARSLKCHFVVLSDPLLEKRRILDSSCRPVSE